MGKTKDKIAKALWNDITWVSTCMEGAFSNRDFNLAYECYYRKLELQNELNQTQ